MGPITKTCWLLLLYLAGECTGIVAPVHTYSPDENCRENKDFDYQLGNRYVYQYVSNVTSFVSETSETISGVQMRATVNIDYTEKCYMVLKLTDVTLSQSTTKDILHWKRLPGLKQLQELEKYPLFFSYNNGLMGVIGRDENDPEWAVNIKRGILSSFHIEIDRFSFANIEAEINILGNCLTSYEDLSRNDNSQTRTVRKKINTNKCDSETPFNTPLLKSDHECIQSIDSSIMKRADCTEIHVFQPFSKRKGSVTSQVHQSLMFVSKGPAPSAPSYAQMVEDTLIYGHDPDEQSQFETDQLEKAETSLRELCKATQDGVQRTNTASLFSELTRRLKNLKMDQLEDIFHRLDDLCLGNAQKKKHFLDALRMTTHPAAAELMTKLILQGEITDAEANIWFMSLAFIKNPTKSLVLGLQPLLNMENPKKAILGISSLLHTYCKSNDCNNDNGIQDLVRKLAEPLGADCLPRSENDITKIIIALKALGNSGTAKPFVTTLEKCFSAPNNPIEIRIAALDALRRMPCSFQLPQQRHGIWKVYSDFQTDSEVRIAAFKALTKCQSTDFIEDLQEILEKEEVNQVGSYVWTYLTYLQENGKSSDKELLKLLRNSNLKAKFSAEARKLSRPFEQSFYSEKMNAKAQVAGDLVFSSKSYLPRSALLNLTVELFGESLNLFEVGGRIEGLEQFVENFFGPNGIYPENTVLKILQSLREKHETEGNQPKENLITEPRGSLYFRVMGNDLHYNSFRGLKTPNEIGLFDVIQRLANAEEIEYSKNIKFLDSDLVIPTTAGLPLRLAIDGTASLDLHAKGHLDLPKLLQNKDTNITTNIRQNAAVQIMGSMTIKAFGFEYGTKMVASLHTATELSSRIIFKKGKLINIQLDAPKDTMELFDISTESILVNGHQEQSISEEKDEDNKELCLGPETTQYLFGVKFCTVISPEKYSLFVQKTDPTLSHYLFEYKTENAKKNDNEYVRYLTLNTPGSQIDREWTGEINLNIPARSFKARLITPFKKIEAEATYLFLEVGKAFAGNLIVDGQKVAAINLGQTKTDDDNILRYQHSLTLKSYESPLVSLSGYTIINEGHKMDLQYTLKHLTPRPIVLSGDATHTFGKESEFYAVEMEAKGFDRTLSISNQLELGRVIVESRASLNYTSPQNEQKNYNIHWTHKDYSSTARVERITMLDVSSSDYPLLSAKWIYTNDSNKIHSLVQVAKGTSSVKVLALLEVNFDIGYYNQNDAFGYTTGSFKLTSDSIMYTYGGKFQYFHTEEVVSISGSLYEENDRQSNEWSRKSKTLSFESSLKLNADQCLWEGSVSWSPGTSYESSFTYKHVKNNLLNDRLVAFTFHQGIDVQSLVSLKGQYRQGIEESIRGEATLYGKTFSVGGTTKTNFHNKTYALDIRMDDQAFASEIELDNSKENLHLKSEVYWNGQRYFYGELKYKQEDDWHGLCLELKFKDFEPGIYIDSSYKSLANGHDINAVLKIYGWKVSFGTKTVGTIHSPILKHNSIIVLVYDDVTVFSTNVLLDVISNNPQKEVIFAIITAGDIGVFTGWYKLPSLKLRYKADDRRLEGEFSFGFRNKAIILMQITSELQMHSRSPNLHFEYDATLTVNKNSLTFHLNYMKPGNTIKVDINALNEIQDGWKFYLHANSSQSMQTANIGTELTMINSRNLRYFGDFRLINQNNHLELDGEFGETKNKFQISGNINWSKKNSALAILHIATPLKHFEMIEITGKYDFQDSSISSFAEVVWNTDKRIALEVTGSHDNDRYERSLAGSAHLTSTEGDLDMLIIASHDSNKDKLRSNMEFKWAEDKAVLFRLNDDKDAKGNKKGLVILNTPYFTSEQKYQYSKDDNFREILYSLSIDERKFAIDVQLSVNSENRKITVIRQLDLKTPFKELQEMTFFVKERLDWNDNYKSIIEYMLKINELEYSCRRDFFLKNSMNFEYSLLIATPHHQFRNLEFQLDHKFDRASGFFHHSKINRNFIEPYELEIHAWQQRSEDFEYGGRLKVKTPTKTYGPYDGELKLKRNEGSYDASAKINYALGKTIQLHSELVYDDKQKKIQLEITSSFPGVENVSFTASHSTNKGPWDASINTQWGAKNQIEMTTSGYFTAKKANFQIRIKTPFENYKNVDLGITYDFNQENVNFFNMEAAAENKRISFQSSLENIDKELNGEVRLKTPFKKFEILAFSLRCLYPNDKKKVELVAQWGENQIVRSTFILAIRNKFGFVISGTAETPLSGYRTISTKLKFDFSRGEKEKINFMFKSERQEMKVQLVSKSPREFSLALQRNDFSVNLHLGYAAYPEKVEAFLKIHYNMNHFESHMSYESSTGHDLTLVIKTPFHGYENYRLSAYIRDKDPQKLLAWMSVSLENNVLVEVKAELDWSEDSASTSLIINILNFPDPVVLLKGAYVFNDLNWKLMGKVKSFDNEAEIQFSLEKDYTYQRLEFKFLTNYVDNHDLHIVAENARTSYYDSDTKMIIRTNLTVSGSFVGNQKIFQGVTAIKKKSELQIFAIYSYGKYQSEITIKLLDENETQLWIEAQTPYSGFEKLSCHISVETTSPEVKKLDIVLTHNEERYEISGSIRNDVHTDVSKRRIGITLQLGSSNKRIEIFGDSSLSNTEGNFQFTIKQNYEKPLITTIEGVYELSLTRNQMNIIINHDGKKSELKILTTTSLSPITIHRSVQLITPYEGYEDSGWSLMFSILDLEYLGNFSYWWNPKQKIVVEGQAKLGSPLEAKFILLTPFVGYKNKSLSFQLDRNSPTKHVGLSFIADDVKQLEISGKLSNQLLRLQIYPPVKSYTTIQVVLKTSTHKNKNIQDEESIPNEENKFQLKNWLFPKMEFEASLSSIEQYKSVFASVKYDFNPTNPFIMLEFKKDVFVADIIFAHDFTSTGGKFQLTSSYQYFKELSFQWKFNWQNEQKEIVIGCVVHEYTMEFRALYQRNVDFINAEVQVQTQFKKFENFKAKFQKDFRRTLKEISLHLHCLDTGIRGLIGVQTDLSVKGPLVNAFVQWDTNKKVVLTFSKSVEGTANIYHLIVGLPSKKCDVNEMKVFYHIPNENDAIGKISTKFCSHKSELTGSLHTVNSRTSGKITASNILVDSAVISTVLDKSTKKPEAVMDIMWNGENRIKIHGIANVGDKSSGNFTITTPFSNFKTFSAKFDLDNQQLQKHFMIVIVPPSEDTIQLSFQGDFKNMNDFWSTVSLTTPLKTLPQLTLKLQNQIKPKEFEGLFELSWTERDHVLATWKIDDGIHVTFDSPISPLKNVQFDASIVKDKDTFTTKAELKWERTNVLGFLIEHTAQPNSLTLNSKLYTPFSDFEEIGLGIVHTQSKNSIDSKATLNLPKRQWNPIKVEVKAKSANKKLSFTTSLQIRRKSLGVSGFVNHNLPHGLNGEVKFYSGLFFENPVKQITFDFAKNSESGTGKFQVETSQKLYNYFGSVSVVDKKIDIKLTADLPFVTSNPQIPSVNGMTPTVLTFVTDYSQEKATFFSSIAFSSVTNSLSGNLEFNSNIVQGQIQITSGFLEEKTLTIEVNLAGQPRQKQAHFVFKTPSNTYRVTGSYSKIFQGMEGSLSVSPALLTIKSFNFHVKASRQNFEGSARVDADSGEHKLSMNFTNLSTKIFGSVVVDTPLGKIGRVALNGIIINGLRTRYDRHQNSKFFKFDLNLTAKEETDRFLAIYQSTLPEFAVQILIKTRLLSVDTIDLTAKFIDKESSSKSFEIILKMRDTYSLQGSIEKTENSFFLETKMNSTRWTPIALALGGSCKDQNLEGKSTISVGPYILDFDFHHNKYDGEASINVTIPVSRSEKWIAVKGSYETRPETGTFWHIETRTSFIKDGGLFLLRGKRYQNKKKDNIIMNVRTPFEGLSFFDLSNTLESNDEKKFISLKLSLPFGQYVFSGELKLNEHDTSVSIGCGLNQWSMKLDGSLTTVPYYKIQMTIAALDKVIVTGDATLHNYLGKTVLEANAIFNERTYSLNGTKTTDEISFTIKTPVEDYENMFAKLSRLSVGDGTLFKIETINNGIFNHAQFFLGGKTVRFEMMFPSQAIRSAKAVIAWNDDYFISFIQNRKQIFKMHVPRSQTTRSYELFILDRSITASFKEPSTSNEKTYSIDICFDSNIPESSTLNLEFREFQKDNKIFHELRLQQPDRTVGLLITNEKILNGAKSTGELRWGTANNERIAYNFIWLSNGYQHDGLLSLAISSQNYSLGVKIDQTNGLSAEIFCVQTGNRNLNTSLLITYVRTPDSKKIEIILQPSLNQDARALQWSDNVDSSQMFSTKLSQTKGKIFSISTLISNRTTGPDNVDYILNFEMNFISNLGMKFDWQLTSDQNYFFTQSTVVVTNSNEKLFHYDVNYNLDKLQKSIKLQITKDIKNTITDKWEITGQAISTSNELGLTIIGNKNHDPATIIRIQVLKGSPTLLFDVIQDKQNKFKVKAMLSEKHIMLQIFHGNNTTQTQDVDFDMNLIKDKLEVRFQWRPDTVSQATDQLSQYYHEYKAAVAYFLITDASHWQETMLYTKFLEGSKQVFDLLFKTQSCWKNILDDFQVAYVDCNEKLQNSPFYKTHISPILNTTLHYLRLWTIVCRDICLVPIEAMKNILPNVWTEVKTMIQSIGEATDSFINYINKLKDSHFQNFRKLARQTGIKIIQKALDLVGPIANLLREFGFNMASAIKGTHTKLMELIWKATDVSLGFLTEDRDLFNALKSKWNEVVQKGHLIWEKSLVEVERTFAHPYVVHATKLTKFIFHMMDEVVWKNPNLYENVRNDLLPHTLYFLLLDYPQLNINTKYNLVYDPSHGKIEYTQQLPMSWENFQEFPDFSKSMDLFKVSEWVKRFRLRLNSIIKDIYHKIIPFPNLSAIETSFNTDCLDPNNNEPFDKEITLTGKMVPQSADVVFVVRNAQCNVGVEPIKKLIEQIEQAAKSNNLTNNRYAIVSFRDDELSLGKIDGSIFNDFETTMHSSLLEISPRNDVSSYVPAIDQATELPFRTGVSKSIVVIPCDLGYLEMIRAEEGNFLLSKLKDQDIVLHVFLFKTLLAYDDPPEQSWLALPLEGQQYSHQYTTQIRKTFLDGTFENSYHNTYRRAYSHLSLKSKGSIFHQQRRLAMSPRETKFQMKFAEQIALMAMPHNCQNCKCVDIQSGRKYALCRSCE